VVDGDARDRLYVLDEHPPEALRDRPAVAVRRCRRVPARRPPPSSCERPRLHSARGPAPSPHLRRECVEGTQEPRRHLADLDLIRTSQERAAERALLERALAFFKVCGTTDASA